MPEEQDIVTQDEQDDTTNGSGESIETLTAQKRIALEQRNEARKAAEELQNRVKELEGLVAPKTTETQTVKEDSNFATKDELEPLKFAMTHKDYGEEEMNKLLVLAKAYGSLDKANASEEFQFWKEKKSEERATANAIPGQNRSGRIEETEIPSPVKDREAHKKFALEQLNK